MKRTPLKRGVSRLVRRTPLRQIGKRGRAHQDEMRELRPQVFTRDRYECRARFSDRCNGRAEHAHHLLPRSAGGRDMLSNLLSVCRACHHEIHHVRPADARDRGLLRSRYGRKVA